MKLIFHVILFLVFIYVNSQLPNNKTINGCGKIGYDQPEKDTDCQDSSEICCYVEVENKDATKSFCAPAPEIINLDDVKTEIEQYTGFNVVKLKCFNFSEKIKFVIGNLLLLGLILV